MRSIRLIILLILISGFTISDNIIRILRGHEWSVTDIEISKDGDLLISGGWDKTLKLWSLKDYTELFSFPSHEEMIWDVIFSRDESYIASCSWDGSINIWEVDSKKLINSFNHSSKYEKIQHEPFFYKSTRPNMCISIDFSPDNKMIASGSSDGMIRIWDVIGNNLLEVINIHDSSSVEKVKFSKTGDKLFSTSNKVLIYDLKTKQIENVFDGHKGAGICSMDLDKNERFLLTGDIAIHNPLIILWDLKTGDSIRVFKGHETIIRDVCFSNNQKVIASVGEDNLIKIWSIENGEALKTMSDDDGKELNTICFSKDDQQIIYGSQDKTIKFRDISEVMK